jgi:PNKP adenylyltransferase domain, ligase domain/ARG and Rhodanese-Phosphatase-superfamily-associated Protein domain
MYRHANQHCSHRVPALRPRRAALVRGPDDRPALPESGPVADYVGLDEAVATGVTVTEVDEAGVVESLLVSNPLGTNVLLYEGEELVGAIANLAVDTTNPSDEQRATTWWQDLIDAGGEGMVVKPMAFVVRGRRDLIQPRSRSAATTTCGSSTGPNTQSHRTSKGSAAAAFGPSGRSRYSSSRSESRRSSASCAKSHFAGCTSAASASLHSRASRSTHGSERCVHGYAVIRLGCFSDRYSISARHRSLDLRLEHLHFADVWSILARGNNHRDDADHTQYPNVRCRNDVSRIGNAVLAQLR